MATQFKYQMATFVLFLASAVGLSLDARGQATAPATPSADSQDAARREILDSRRWRQTRRDLDEWLSMQRLYTAQEVATIRAQLEADVARMSPAELEDFMLDMEDRLDVLLSRDAEDARVWVSQFLATARNAEEKIRNKRPDVLNLSAGEIRLELQRFQRQRGSRQQSQAAFDQGRSQQLQSAQSAHAASRQAQAQVADSRSRAAENAQAQREATANRNASLNHSEFYRTDVGAPYAISPWGTPIRWNALSAPNR